jgi:hypothetical protein
VDVPLADKGKDKTMGAPKETQDGKEQDFGRAQGSRIKKRSQSQHLAKTGKLTCAQGARGVY